jgi:hypothetical protein
MVGDLLAGQSGWYSDGAAHSKSRADLRDLGVGVKVTIVAGIVEVDRVIIAINSADGDIACEREDTFLRRRWAIVTKVQQIRKRRVGFLM